MLLPLPATTTKRLLPSSLTHLDSLVIYIVASLFATFLVSFLFTKTEYKFPFPYVVNCIQLAIGWLICSKTPIASLFPSSSATSSLPTSTAPLQTKRLLLPVTAAYIGWLVVNPLFLIHVPLNAYQIFTGLALPLTHILISTSYFHKTTKISQFSLPHTLVACGMYYFGFWLSSEGFGKISWQGTILGFFNAFFLALYGVLAKNSLTLVDPWTLVRHNVGWGCLVMIPFGLYNWFTWPGPVPAFVDELGFWFQMILTGSMGLGLQMITIVLIKLASPMIQTSAAGVKVCLQAILAAAILGNPISKMSLLGIAIALSGASCSMYHELRKV